MAQKQSKTENKALSRMARQQIVKSPLDINELNIDCSDGNLELSGLVRPPRGQSGVINVRREYEIIKTTLRTVRGVKDVLDRAKVIEH